MKLVEIPLQFPNYEYKIKEIVGKRYIFDSLRKKFLFLSPEEWVRQHVLNYLIHFKQYPRSLIQVEAGIKFNSLKKRSDILVSNPQGNAHLLIECKAPSVKINQSTLFQASRYNYTYRAPFLMVTNGLETFSYKIDWETGVSIQIQEIPPF